jgi:hypothetical protein
MSNESEAIEINLKKSIGNKTMQITIDIPETLQRSLLSQAAQTQTTPEQLIIQLLAQNLTPTTFPPDLSNDPLFKLIGCIDTDISDVAENHDHYIGQAIYEEMHRDDK